MSEFDLIRDECERLGYAFWPSTKPFDLFLFGVRNRELDTNAFDDTIGCAYISAAGVATVERFPATTDPGKRSMEHPTRPAGCATVIPRQNRKLWTKGYHRGTYECLVPVRGAVVPVWRGYDRTKVYFDADGIQLHHAGDDSKVVDGWSAGCQVVQKIADFGRIMWLYDEQVRRLGIRYVSYTLFDVDASPALAPLLARG